MMRPIIARQIVLDAELLDLATEIFENSYGMDWDTAVDQAIESFSDLFDLAVTWDTEAAIEALEYAASGQPVALAA